MEHDVPLKKYYGHSKFAQPYIAAWGYVASGGSIGNFMAPESLSVSKTGTGVYLVSHKIGFNNRYVLIPTPQSTAGIIATTANVNADSVEVRTFTVSGNPGAPAAADSGFSFVIYSF